MGCVMGQRGPFQKPGVNRNSDVVASKCAELSLVKRANRTHFYVITSTQIFIPGLG